MDYVRQILGEAEKPDEEKKKKDKGEEKPKSEPKSEPKAKSAQEAPTEEMDSEVQELANLWNTGNREDLLRRFMDMDNETAVKVVFAIGREGAIELARMADQEALAAPVGGEEGQGEATTEPMSVEGPGAEEGYPIRDIMGTNDQGAHLQQFRKDRSASPAGEAVRQELGIR